jgi:glycosyltransferase involved in cell wall biosynthesis
MSGMSRNDVAIYLPSTGGIYDRARARSAGAERQMVLLAQVLSERGYRVAQIVWPVADPVALPPGLTLVERRSRQAGSGALGALRELSEIWRSLSRADPKVLVVRKRQGALPVAALFCRLRRRRLIFSSANDAEFMLQELHSGQPRGRMYKLCLRVADAVVVQSAQQVELARSALPRLRRVVRIPSFADDQHRPEQREPEAFLWIGRIVDYKQPLRYVELARALPDARFVMIAMPDISEPDSPLLPVLRAAPEDTPNLEVLEPLAHSRVGELVTRAVAIVNTTSRFEGMPNTYLEAWSAGVPVLTLEFDPDEVVAEHGLGISAAGSWDRFVVGARELWDGRRKREELARRVRAYVQEVHSLKRVGDSWTTLIDDLIGAPPTSPSNESTSQP